MDNKIRIVPDASPTLLDDVEVHPDTNELIFAGEVVRLKPKVMLVLTALIEGRGSVVTKSEILDRVWPNMAVADNVLTEAIHELRHALSDDAKKPRYVQTIPRKGYRIVAQVRLPDSPSTTSSEENSKPRIAVTFFKSLSADPEDQYFCEGLCEELINRLGRSKHIDVLARTWTLGAPRDESMAHGIVEKLGATHLVSGTLRKEESNIRVMAHLTDAATGTETWSEVYDRKLRDFVALQAEIARQIVAAVSPQLEHATDSDSANTYVPDPEAFREFSKGRHFWHQDTSHAEKALMHYETAIEIDPSFAAPYAGLVECYNSLGFFHRMPPAIAREASTRYAEQALFLDPGSPESLFAFGYTQFYMRWNWKSAEAAFFKSLAVNPNHALAHIFLSLLYCPLRRRQDSRRHADIAIRLDPFSPMIRLIDFVHYHYFGDYQGALASVEQALDLSPQDVVLNWGRADTLLRLGRKREALQRVIELDEISADFPLYRACAGVLYTMLDRPEDALRIEKDMQLGPDDDVQDPFISGLFAIYRNRQEFALDMLERAELEHDPLLWIVAREPYFDPLRENERFVELLQRLDLSR